MLFVIGSLFGLWIGATRTNRSHFTKNSLLPKIVEKWEVRKAKKTGILWIRRIKKTACNPHPKIMIVLNNYRQTTSCFSKPLKVSFFLIWISFEFNSIFFFSLTEPTQIYRYLRTRNMISPIFLHRSLTFMGKRRSRQQSDKLRQDFKVDSLLKRKESEIRDSDSLSMNDRFMNLTFLGYYDKKSKTLFLGYVIEF